MKVDRRSSPYGHEVQWPFKSELSLHSIEDKSETTLTDPQMVNFVLRHLTATFHFAAFTSEDGVNFELVLESVPEWFEPADIENHLGAMVADDEDAGRLK